MARARCTILKGTLLLLLFCAASARAQSSIVINEIMYHPSSENVLEEYIELFNRSGTNVDLGGWTLSKAVSFTFPSNTIVRGTNYLVVAAHRPTFQAKYPTVTNVIGNWVGTLNNQSDEIQLNDTLGQRVAETRYSDDGDWAARKRTYELGRSGTNVYAGWDWEAGHDGLGKSAELMNPTFAESFGQNWSPSVPDNGTPGRVNSVVTTNIAPVLLDVAHSPLIPQPTDTVAVTARVVDEAGANVGVFCFFRTNGVTVPTFSNTNMVDDGAHGDGLEGDGIYGALLPAHPAGTIVEFYVQSTDPLGRTRTWPAPGYDTNGFELGQVVNALYQVDTNVYTGMQHMYRLIMTEAERTLLASIPSNSTGQGPNARMNGTFISFDGRELEVRYRSSFRNRGHGSRSASPPNYHVDFLAEQKWKGVTAINLNSVNVHAQHIGSALALKSGVAGANSRPVQVRVNGRNLAVNTSRMFGSYACNEVLDGDWAEHRFPSDGEGNIYKVVRDIIPPNFDYRGEDYTAYTNTYFKENNVSENDWTDLIGMLEVMGENRTDLYTTQRARQVINVEQWLRHLAVMNIYANGESGLNTGNNDDYFMYRGVNDPRFNLLFWDLDSVLGVGSLPTNTDIFRATCCPISSDSEGSWRAMAFWMRHPDIEPLYYKTMQRLLDTTFSKPNFDALVDHMLSSYVTNSSIVSMKTWMDGRRAYIQGQIAGRVPADPPQAVISGEPRSPTPFTTATLTVSGSNVVSYRFRLNGGGFGAETSVGTPISFNGLSNGSTNTVYVIGKSSDGLWQDMGNATQSKVWVIKTSMPAIRLNEVLAQNDAAVNHGGTFPDIIELYNEGPTGRDLGGLRITDDPAEPNKFVFASGTFLSSGAYLRLYANDVDGTGGIHVGFSLDADGEGIYLFDANTNLLDSVVFGPQLSDLSIGRFGFSGDWKLCQPTLGGVNTLQPLGEVTSVRVNEWLASGVAPFFDDFVELYNPNSLPVDLGNCYLTDEPIGAPKLHRLPPLTFIAANGFFKLNADGNAGPRHLSFSLSADHEQVGFMDANGAEIDCVIFNSQRPGLSQGRCPDGAPSFRSLITPTPGAPNICPIAPPTPTSLLAYSDTWRYQTNNLDGILWTSAAYDDSGWTNGAGVLGFGGSVAEPTRTTLPSGRNTYYFRTRFVFPTNTSFASLLLSHYFDDGAVVYLNGSEIYRYNFTNNPAYYTNFSATGISGPPSEISAAFPMANLLPGTNVLAIEVHQSGPSSSDLYMGFKIEGIPNTAATAGVFINEVLANNQTVAEADGSTPDWVEFYNPSATSSVLSGLSLTDDVTKQRRWVFPAGSIIPSRGYFRVLMDGDSPASGTNTGFGLSQTGSPLYLFTPDGGLLDSVIFGLQAADYSIGRLTNSTNWVLTVPTPHAPNSAAALGNVTQLKVNEWLANPASGDDWFEIYNPNPQPVALENLWLTDDLRTPTTRMQHQIARLSFIGVGPFGYQLFHADSNPQNGADHVNFNLRAAGDSVGISLENGNQLDGISFVNQPEGVSEGRFPDGSEAVTNFPASMSPEEMNWLPLTNLVINEVLTHTDLPLEDAIEILNTNAASVNINGWFLSNQKTRLKKYPITNALPIPAAGFRVYYETQFNNVALAPNNFTLNAAHGDNVYLSQASNGVLTGFRAQIDFGAAENGVSMGRYRTSVGAYDFVRMSARTFGVDNPGNVTLFRTGTGKTNAYPAVGPVVISEIMCHPPNLDNSDNARDEFIELRNLTTNTALFYDPNYPTNRWRLRGAVDFDFPPYTSLGATGSLLVVGFDPVNDPATLAAFKSAYSIAHPATIVGPWKGKLGNNNESISLEMPDSVQLPPHRDAGFVPFVRVERIRYSTLAPWPTNVSATGRSLQRTILAGYGNDPTNWNGALPTPAPAFGNGDIDGDGMPDSWEEANGLQVGVNDANLDADSDGMSNLSEFRAGTNPQNANSRLSLLVSRPSTNSVRLSFDAATNVTYSIQHRTSLSTGAWLRLQNFGPFTTARSVAITNGTTNVTRFYQVVTPQQP